jgi:ABC-2 type transport system ATP-binding protein
VLEIRDVSKTYGTRRVLDDVSFDVAPGRMTGFVGGNGAGKTTTMRIILGVLEADAGTVTLDGAPLGPTGRRRFGYMPEERGLYPKMKLAEQLIYLARLHGLTPADAKSNTDRLLARLGLGERAGDAIEKLSLGNQQRAQIAAALVHDPEVLILDEPFSGLDPISIETVGTILREQADNGVAVVFSSHQLDLVEDYCQRVTIVNHGRTVIEGDLADLQRGTTPVLSVQVDGDKTGAWAKRLRGVKITHNEGGHLRLALGPTADAQAVLAAAQKKGPVIEFSFVRLRLSEVFIEAIQDTAK